MSIIESIILGIIQGLTEFLPVSSSGHLVLTKAVLNVDLESNLFMNVMLHIGTLVAVLIVYYKLIINLVKELFFMVKDIFTGKFKFSKMNDERNMIVMLVIGLLPLFLLFVPIPFTNGLNLKDLAEILSGSNYLYIVGLSLILTSALLTLGSRANKLNASKGRLRERYTVVDSIVVGLTQCVAAVLPGLSRSGSTLATAQLRGIDKQKALDYTFVMGIPSIFAAAVLELKDAFEADINPIESIGIIPIIAGIIVSAVVGILAIKLFKWMLNKDRVYVFSIYTVAIGLITIAVSIMTIAK